MWVPSHINIPANELSDAASKRAALSSPDEGILTRYIQANINKWNYFRSLNRRQQSVLCRLRIGHCNLTHSYLLSGDLRPMCSVCNVRLTVDHLMIECQLHSDIRRELQDVQEYTNPDQGRMAKDLNISDTYKYIPCNIAN
nr:unnamed protein product [Callosobruchus chinensis]